jgi:hypothetical protein
VSLTLISIIIGLLSVASAIIAKRYAAHTTGLYAWFFAVVGLPAGLTVGLWQQLPRSSLAGLLIFVTSAYWVLSRSTRTGLPERWPAALALAAVALPLAAAVMVGDTPAPLVLCLLAAIVTSAELSLRLRQAWFALVALFVALLVPLVIGQADPSLDTTLQAWVYVGAAAILVLWRLVLSGLGESFDTVGVAGYLIALLLALGFAVEGGPLATMTVALAVAGGLYYLSYWEPPPAAFVYAAAIVAGYALLQVTDIFGWPISIHSLILAGLGLVLYLTGAYSDDDQRAHALRYGGLVLAFMGVYPGLLSPVPPLEPVVALAVGGLLLRAEARRQNRPATAELGGGIAVLALAWLLRHYRITEIQWYTLPFAAYFARLAYHRRDADDPAAPDLFTAISLAFLTIPLAGQALTSGGQGYGLILIFEALGLIIIGNAINYRLVTLWGAFTLTAAGLYQFLTFIASGGLIN